MGAPVKKREKKREKKARGKEERERERRKNSGRGGMRERRGEIKKAAPLWATTC